MPTAIMKKFWNEESASRPRRITSAAVAVLFLLFAPGAFAQTPISLYNAFSGKYNYVVIGGSLRTLGNTIDAVTMKTADTTVLSLPNGATVVAAYLYWAGSGSTVDNIITFDGTSYTADRTFTESYNNGGMLYWFGGFKDISSYVTSLGNPNKSYIFTGLTVDTTNNYAASQAALGGWAMVIIYNDPNGYRRTVNIYDGFKVFRGSQIILAPNNFYVPYNKVDGRMTHITWEGDVENSAPLNGYSEQLSFNGFVLTDVYNPSNNQFNSVSNTLFALKDSTFGVDIDTYDVTTYLRSGDTTATSLYSSGGDLVILNAEVISVADTSNSDVQITKTHSGGTNVIAGNQLTYTLTAKNNGPDTTGTITVRDSLPSAAQCVSVSMGSGWTVDSSARPLYVFTHAGYHAPNTTLPTITITVSVKYDPSSYPTLKNVATISSPQFDRRPWNNTSVDSITVVTPVFVQTTKTFTDINGTVPIIGDTLRYTITVKNTGNYDVSVANGNPISVTDSVPSGFTIVPGSITPGGTISGQAISFNTITSLLQGASTALTYRIKTGSSFVGDTRFINTVHARASTVDQVVQDTATPPPIVKVMKSFDPGKTKARDTITVRIIVQNQSAITKSTGTTITDTLETATGFTYMTNSVVVDGIAKTDGNDADSSQYISTAPARLIIRLTGTKNPGSLDTITYKIRAGTSPPYNIHNKATLTNDQRSRDTSGAYVYIRTNATGSISGQASILPGDTLYYTLIDGDLNTSATSVQTFTDSVFNIRTGEWEFVNFSETGVNTGIFAGKRVSVYGTTSNGNNNGTLACQPNDTLRITYIDAIDSAGNTNQVRTWNTVVRAGNTATLTGTSGILPGDTIYYTLTDNDLNRNSSLAESYVLKDTNKVTGESENITVTETGANTGIFTGKILTTFGTTAGTNNDGRFNAQANDSIVISYRDTVTATGQSGGWITFRTNVRSGNTATLTATAAIFPWDSVLVTVTDNDLNKNASLAESYTVVDSAVTTGEVENTVVTETGPNTGVFQKWVKTRYGVVRGANNDGFFYVHAGDTLQVTYKDTIQANGGPGATVTAHTAIKNGNPATLTVSPSPIFPGDSVQVSLTDVDLNKNASAIESYSLRDSNIVTGEWENITVTETGINTGIFTKWVKTQFGLSAGTNNDGVFNGKVGDSLLVTYLDTVTTNGAPGTTIKAGSGFKGGVTATISASTPIYPADSILVTITDNDLNKNASAAESYAVQDTNKTTGEWETITVTETGVNTGVFTKWVRTQFGLTAGTNNDGIFNTKAGDTLVVTYRDSLQVNGGPATLTAKTSVRGGATALLTATSNIFPGDTTYYTLTDADLNKDTTTVQSYSIKDSSKTTGEVELLTFTETGANTNVFAAKIASIFGTSAGTNNDGKFNVKAGDTLIVSYRDTVQANGGPGAVLMVTTSVKGYYTATLTSASGQIHPGDSLLVTITDKDLNKNPSVIESYTVQDTNKTTGEWERITVTERSVNDSVFTKWVKTQFGLTAGTNNDGIFNVKSGDTLVVTYKDTLQTNGGPGALLTAGTAAIGGVTATISAATPAFPGDSVLVTITDNDLNKNVSAIESYTVQDTNKTTGEWERMTVTETGPNTGVFTKWVRTQFGLAAGTNNDGIFNVKAGDTLIVTYRDSLQANGGAATLTAATGVKGFNTATLTVSPTQTHPADSILVSIADPDLNKNAFAIESYAVQDTNKTTGEWERITVTETGANTGVFTKWVRTQFGLTAGTNNDGIFNVKAGDTLVVTYKDTLQANGGPGAVLTAGTGVKGGVTGTISANPILIAANDTSTFTITDADLNKNASLAESYTFTGTSSTGETEMMTFTETAANTGIFTKRVPTVSGPTPGPNNNGVFTAQPGDSIWVTYRDSLTANGGTATISAYCKIGAVNFSTSTKSYVDLRSGGTVKPPDTLAYTLRVKNSGTAKATTVAVTDTVPSNVTVLAGTITGGGTVSGRVITFALFNLAVGDSTILQYHIRVDSTIQNGIPATNIAHVIGNGVDQKLTASFTPVNTPVMAMHKSVVFSKSRPGDTLTYTITYSNTGTTQATFVTITDASPNNTTYISNSTALNGVPQTDAPGDDAVTLTGSTLTIVVGNVNPGTVGTVTFKVRIN